MHAVLADELISLDCMSITEPDKQIFYSFFHQSELLPLFEEQLGDLTAFSKNVSVTFVSVYT
jgi:hypothetical protein